MVTTLFKSDARKSGARKSGARKSDARKSDVRKLMFCDMSFFMTCILSNVLMMAPWRANHEIPRYESNVSNGGAFVPANVNMFYFGVEFRTF
jgi:hypothetical protein